MGSANGNKQVVMSFIEELKRRNVFRVGLAYVIAAWILIEVTATTFPVLKLPDWSVTLVTAFLLIGFPVALILAWAYELTPEGIKLEKDVVRSESITHITGHWLFSWPVRDVKAKRHTDRELKPRKNYSCIGKFT